MGDLGREIGGALIFLACCAALAVPVAVGAILAAVLGAFGFWTAAAIAFAVGGVVGLVLLILVWRAA